MIKFFINNNLFNKVLLIICLFTTHSANATLITFEELGQQDLLFSNNPPLTNQYDHLGIIFSGGWEVIHQDAMMGEMPLSGEHFLGFNTLVSGITNTLTMNFTNSINSFSGYLGGGLDDCCYIDMEWSVLAFLDQQLIFQDKYVSKASPSGGGYAKVSINFNEVNRIQIIANPTLNTQGFSGVIDDISFSQITSVPEPSTLAVFLLSLLGLSSRRIKK